MKKKNIKKLFKEKILQLPPGNQNILTQFINEAAKQMTVIGHNQKKALLDDYRAAILYYLEHDYSIDFILDHLDWRKLGSFYKQRTEYWFPLDYAARVHSLTISKNWMSIFRLSFSLKQDIVPELLQTAMTFTIKRFPLFSTTIKRGFFWHYIDSSQQRYRVEPETDIPCSPIKVSRADSPSLRVIYYRNRISIECFHILTDGLGGMIFLKTLVVEYLNLLGKTIPPDKTFFNINDRADESELENGYAKAERMLQDSQNIDLLQTPELPAITPALAIEGKLSRIKPYRILHLEMKSKALKQLSENKGVKVTTLILGFLIAACMKTTGKKSGTIKIQVPVNMRPYYNSNTIANFTQYCIIKIKKQDAPDFDSILREAEAQLIRGTSADVLNQAMMRSNQLANRLKWVPLFIKRSAFRLVFRTISDRVYTTSLSNLGVVRLPEELSNQVDKIQCLLGAPTINRESCTLISYGDTTSLSITKVTRASAFEDNLAKIITEHGLKIYISGSEPYES